MRENKLKIYIKRNLLRDKLSYTPLLFPFLGPILKESTPYLSAVYKKYIFDKSYYELVDEISECDFVLAPYNYWLFGDWLADVFDASSREALKFNKPLLIDAMGDPHRHLDYKNAYYLVTSPYKFGKRENEIVVPTYAEDLLETHCEGKLQLREKQHIPSVGFVGWGGMPIKLYIKTIIKELPVRFLSIFNRKYGAFKKGIFFRQKALAVLKNSSLVKSNFIIKNFFSGHVNTAKGDMREARDEFVNNIANSDYVLCTKGDGNFSIRFYETLSMGRIPLFVDTQCVLPLEDKINYKEFCVFVDYKDLRNIDKVLSDFHNSVSDEQFISMQKKARDAFENYLRIDKFTKYMVRELKNISEGK